MSRRRKTKKNDPFATIIIIGAVAVASGGSLAGSLSRDGSRILALVATLTLAVGGLIIGWLILAARRKQLALRALRLADVDRMTGPEFEDYVAALLKHQGYKTTLTKVSGDFGVDIIAQKAGASIAVQVKRYSSRLDQKPVREAVAGRAHYKCTKSMVVTNSSFTAAAVILAASNNCQLVDGETLGDWIIDFSQSRKPES